MLEAVADPAGLPVHDDDADTQLAVGHRPPTPVAQVLALFVCLKRVHVFVDTGLTA